MEMAAIYHFIPVWGDQKALGKPQQTWKNEGFLSRKNMGVWVKYPVKMIKNQCLWVPMEGYILDSIQFKR